MTIYNALRAKLGRTPTNEELRAEVKRIIAEGCLLGTLKRLRKKW